MHRSNEGPHRYRNKSVSVCLPWVTAVAVLGGEGGYLVSIAVTKEMVSYTLNLYEMLPGFIKKHGCLKGTVHP